MYPSIVMNWTSCRRKSHPWIFIKARNGTQIKALCKFHQTKMNWPRYWLVTPLKPVNRGLSSAFSSLLPDVNNNSFAMQEKSSVIAQLNNLIMRTEAGFRSDYPVIGKPWPKCGKSKMILKHSGSLTWFWSCPILCTSCFISSSWCCMLSVSSRTISLAVLASFRWLLCWTNLCTAASSLRVMAASVAPPLEALCGVLPAPWWLHFMWSLSATVKLYVLMQFFPFSFLCDWPLIIPMIKHKTIGIHVKNTEISIFQSLVAT